VLVAVQVLLVEMVALRLAETAVLEQPLVFLAVVSLMLVEVAAAYLLLHTLHLRVLLEQVVLVAVQTVAMEQMVVLLLLIPAVAVAGLALLDLVP
jgi:hypothetical protein